ncbi:hypothetical protein Scep_030716 [Stephania cephalantha]|uniref:Uncharacterized protein n=1 Tax=Stephania cephalantha TaxID=152367 RepID=A0AAP0E2Z6_9MAGN
MTTEPSRPSRQLTRGLHEGAPNHPALPVSTNNPNDKAAAAAVAPNKRPCLSDRATAFSIDSLDLSKLSLFDDERGSRGAAVAPSQGKFRWMRNKKRRRGSRSVSGRSSDRSGTRRCCSVGAAGTCSDFPVAAAGGTDSSGELFVSNGDPNWSSDVSEARNSRNSRRERRDSVGEKESLGSGNWVGSNGVESQGNESGYGSEPGYRGDAEFGYGDEFDEEEDDGRVLFWGERIGDTDCKMEIVGESQFSEQKSHHRGRRKKHDCR